MEGRLFVEVEDCHNGGNDNRGKNSKGKNPGDNVDENVHLMDSLLLGLCPPRFNKGIMCLPLQNATSSPSIFQTRVLSPFEHRLRVRRWRMVSPVVRFIGFMRVRLQFATTPSAGICFRAAFELDLVTNLIERDHEVKHCNKTSITARNFVSFRKELSITNVSAAKLLRGFRICRPSKGPFKPFLAPF
jgi:hypothetical protein